MKNKMTNKEMTNKEIRTEVFKKAHMLTRYTVKDAGGDYRATFSASLKMVIAAAKKSTIDYELYGFVNETIGSRREMQKAAELNKNGIREVLYSEYKRNFEGFRTVKGSYDKKYKTIQIYVGNNTNDLCPHCGTYCYGDCQINKA